ncbi:MAG: chaperone modulator CbpM [Flavobacteriaceae bacterium]|nr:chaperone modulator CbpM [Psychroflexus sp.]
MEKQNLIEVKKLCVHYKIEYSFFEELDHKGLIQIETLQKNQYIHQDVVGDLERMIRIYRELNVNVEGIDVVFNLLQKELRMREEIKALKNKLRLYTHDF